MARYYPICVEIAHFPCLVVGGGEVGLRKVRVLLDHGGRVTVVAVGPLAALERLAQEGQIRLHRRAYQPSDLDGMRLVFVATDDEQLNRRIADDARQRGILVNVVDDPALCDFIVPSIVRRGPLILAISTEGECPAYAKHLRRMLEGQFDAAYADFVELLGEMRREIQSRVADQKRGARLIERLVGENLLETVRDKGRAVAEALARQRLEEWLRQS